MSTTDTPPSTQPSTGFLMLRLGDAARDNLDRELERWQITGRQLRVLGHARAEPLSQQELCDRTGMDRTTMVAAIDKMESLGYAIRTRSATDRRKHLIELTDRGIQVADETFAHLAHAEGTFLTPLTSDEQATLHDLLMKLYLAHDPTCRRP